MYKLFCDTDCELWHTIAKEYDIGVIKMPYTVNNVEYYYDLGEDFDKITDFYKAMRAGAVPVTAALNEFDYIEYFEPVLKAGMDVYYITFSHKLSATFESMAKAIGALEVKYPDRHIRYFDTKSICLGSGLQVELAARKYKEGATEDELEAYLTYLASHTYEYFVVDDLVYLKRGGRISGATSAIGNLLNIKPLISVVADGSLENIGKIKGRKRVIGRFIELMEAAQFNGTDKMYVLQADCEKDGADLLSAIRERFGNGFEADCQIVGPVIAAHCGPGTLGVAFVGDLIK